MSDDAEAIRELRSLADSDAPCPILHYLYVPKRRAAAKAARELRARGFNTETRLGGDGVNWLVLARHEAVPTEQLMASLRRTMEVLSAEVGGEYDGWEAEVQRAKTSDGFAETSRQSNRLINLVGYKAAADYVRRKKVKRPKIGDIVEIKTRNGFSYAHYSHKHSTYGALLRVFNQAHDNRPSSFGDIVLRKPSFLCFFPLGAALNQKIVTVVGNVPVPLEAQAFPLFRDGLTDPRTRKVDVWWLWDGEREWRVGNLSADQRKLSIRGIWNDTLLIERIEARWTPEKDS